MALRDVTNNIKKKTKEAEEKARQAAAKSGVTKSSGSQNKAATGAKKAAQTAAKKVTYYSNRSKNLAKTAGQNAAKKAAASKSVQAAARKLPPKAQQTYTRKKQGEALSVINKMNLPNSRMVGDYGKWDRPKGLDMRTPVDQIGRSLYLAQNPTAFMGLKDRMTLLSPMDTLNADKLTGRKYWRSRTPEISMSDRDQAMRIVKNSQRAVQNRRAAKQELSDWDRKNLNGGEGFQVQQAKQRYMAAAKAGRMDEAEKAHREAEMLRGLHGYSGGAAGNEYITPDVPQDVYNRLNSQGVTAWKQAQMQRQRAVTEDEIAKADQRIREVLNAKGYQKGPQTDADTARGWDFGPEGRRMWAGTREQNEKDAAQGKAALQATGEGIVGGLAYGMQIYNQANQDRYDESNMERWIRDAADYVSAENDLEYYDNFVKQFGRAPDDMPNRNVLVMRLNNAIQAKAQLERIRGDVDSPYFDPALAEYYGLPTTRDETLGERMLRQAAEHQTEATEGMSGAEKFFTNAMISTGQSLPGMALGVIPGVGTTLGLGLMGVQAGGSRAYQLKQQGLTTDEAFLGGLVSGGIEVLTERLPLENFAKIVNGKSGRTALKNILRQAGLEGTEEAVSYVGNYIADEALKHPDAQFSWLELLENAGMGAVAGAAFGTAGSMIAEGSRRSSARQVEDIQEESAGQAQAVSQAQDIQADQRTEEARRLLEDAQSYQEMAKARAYSEGEKALVKAALEERYAALAGAEAAPRTLEEAAQQRVASPVVQEAQPVRQTARETVQADLPPLNYERSKFPPSSLLGSLIDAARENNARKQAAEEARAAQAVTREAQRDQAPVQVEAPRREARTATQPVGQARSLGAENRTVGNPVTERVDPVARMAATLGDSGAKAMQAAGREVFGNSERLDYGRAFTQVYDQAVSGKSQEQIRQPQSLTRPQFYAAVQAGMNDRTAKSGTVAGRNRNAGVDWRDQYVRQMDRKTARMVDGVAKSLGVQVIFADEGSILTGTGAQANAEIVGNVVRIEKNNPNPVRKLIGHELTHRMQDLSPETYQTFRDYVMSIPGAQNALEQTLALYESGTGGFTREAAMDELAADFAGELWDSSEKLQDFIRKNYTNRTLLERVRDAFRALAAKLTGREKVQADEAVRLLEDALGAAGEAVKTMGVTENATGENETRHSIKTIFDAAGLNARLQNGRVVVTDRNGKAVNKVTQKMVRESGIGALISYARDETGVISAEDAETQIKGAADLLSMMINAQDGELVWRFAGSAMFSAVKSNSDGQYGTTIDFSTVCRKTQEMMTAMSNAMVDLGRGLTKDEVIELQADVLTEGGTVPCPVCYVFSRWAGVGGILDNMAKFQKKYGHDYDDPAKLNARIEQLEKATKKKADLRAMLREHDTNYMELTRQREELEEDTKAKKKQRTSLNRKKPSGHEEMVAEINQAIKTNDALLAQVKADIKKMEDEGAPELAWLKRVRSAEDYWERGNVPENVLFNMDDAATFAEAYPLAWGYRTTRGPSAGKAILPYSDMRLGDLILGAGKNSAKGDTTFRTVEGGQFNDEQMKKIDKALGRTLAQNLIGGQRFQSTSDFRYDYGLDYLQVFWEAQALGSKMQTYTKIIEFAELAATIGGDVNVSMMPLNSGLDENGNLLFSSVTGADINAALKANDMYDSLQLILVGINDDHIMTALDDFSGHGGENIGFVIPYHASGASINRFIRGLVENLNETFNEDYYKDYSPVQTDSRKKVPGASEETVAGWMDAMRENPKNPQFTGRKPNAVQRRALEQRLRNEIRLAILKHRVGSSAEVADALIQNTRSFFRGKSKDISGMSFDDLRAIEKRALAGDQAAIREYASWSNGVLWDLYQKMWVDKSARDTYGVKLSTSQAGAVMPHEYWNRTANRSQAYINGFIFRSYCYNLGLIPRFTGLDFSGRNVGYGDFSDSAGYWKTLIDRAMYDNQGNYREQQKINVTNVTKEMLTPEYGEERWGDYKVREPSEKVARAAADRFVGRRQSEAEELSDVNVRYSIRTDPPPKKTGTAYKVFFAKDGQLYPPMVANPGGAGTPVGVWLDADVGQQAPPSKTGRAQVKAGGKGTQGGSGSLAFRPGWHLGDVPHATQFARMNPETGKKELFPANFVWAECEYAADVNYQDEAMSYGYTENGKFRHSYAGLPRLPQDGYYRYRTNPKPDTVPWIITGAMKVKRILTDEETDAICRENGVEPMARQGGPLTAERMAKELGIKSGSIVPHTAKEYSNFSISVEEINPAEISPLNGITDKGKHDYLAKDFAENGWNGRPIVVIDMGNSYAAVTGSHRIFAAQKAGIDTQAVVIDANDDVLRLLNANGDEGRAAVAKELADDGLLPRDIADLIIREDDLNYENWGVDYQEQKRFSIGTGGFDQAKLMRENEKLRDRVEYWKGQTKRSDRTKTDPKEVRKLAKKLAGDFSTTMDTTEISAQLQAIYDGLGKDWTYDQAYEAAHSLAIEMVEQASETDGFLYNEYEPLRKFFRETPLVITPEIKRGITDYNDWRKAQMGRLILKNGDRSNVDQVYQELSQLWPEWFDEERDVSSLDQLERIAEVMDGIYTQEEQNPFQDDLEGPAGYLAAEIMGSFWDMPNVRRTYADRAEARLGREVTRRLDMQEKYQEKLQQVRENRDAKLQAQKEKYLGREKARSQRQKERERRAQIMRHARDLSRKLLKPSDKQHIPQELREAVAAVLDSVNLASKNHKETNRTKAFQELRLAYQDILQQGESLVIDPDLMDNIMEVEAMRDTPIAEMNLSQLETIWKTIRAVEASITTANKAFGRQRFATIFEAADGLRQAMAGRKDRGDYRGPAGAFDKLLNSGMLTPESYFHRMGEMGEKIFRMLRNAQDKHIGIMQEAQNYTKEVVGKTKVRKWEKEIHTFDFGGEKVQLTTAQIMSLYELMKRKQAVDHIAVGGIKPEGVDRGVKKMAPSEPYRLTIDQISEIVDSLTEEQMAMADALQKYMGGRLAQLGNEASMAVYGYEKFNEKNYFPIKVDKNQTITDQTKEAQAATIAGRGFTKSTTPKANNALIVRNIFDVYADHVTDMATYSSWLEAMENLQRIYNFTFRDEENNRTGTVKGYLERTFGKNGLSYWEKLTEDLNNGVHGTNDNPFNSLIGNYKASAIGANIRVFIQQPTAILRALDQISPADFLAGLGRARPTTWAKVKKYAPIAVWKDWGYFDADTGRQMKSILFGDDSALAKVNNGLMAPAGVMDSLGWSHIWNALEAEIRRTRKDLKPRTDAFYEAVAARFNAVIDHSQVVDGILQRSQVMRSPDALTKMATSFMAEPTKVYNMFTTAVYDLKHSQDPKARTQAMKVLGRTTFGLIASFFANAAAQSLVDALRDDDKDEEYWEKFFQAFYGLEGDEETAGEKIKNGILEGNLGAAFNPATYIPWMKDVVSLAQGFKVSRMDMDSISKFVQEIGSTWKAFHGDGKITLRNALTRLTAEGARLLGIPASNIKRDVLAVYSTVMNSQHNYLGQFELQKWLYRLDSDKNWTDFVKIAMAAKNAGDEEAYEKIRADIIANGPKSEDDFDKKIAELEKKAVTDTDEYQTELASLSDSYATMLESNPIFQAMDAELQDKARTTMANYAEYQVLGDRIEVDNDQMANLSSIESQGMNPADWVVFKTQFDTLHSDKDADGKDIPGQKKQDKAIKLIEEMYDTKEERCAVYRTVYDSDANNPWA